MCTINNCSLHTNANPAVFYPVSSSHIFLFSFLFIYFTAQTWSIKSSGLLSKSNKLHRGTVGKEAKMNLMGDKSQMGLCEYGTHREVRPRWGRRTHESYKACSNRRWWKSRSMKLTTCSPPPSVNLHAPSTS